MNIENDLSRMIGATPDGLSEGIALGTGLADGYDLFDSPLGQVVVTFNPGGVSSVDVADDDFEERFAARHRRPLIRAEAPRAWSARINPALESGAPGKLPLDLRSVTPFQESVLLLTATIPRGEVRSYGWLAGQSKHPKATRAVGSTMAGNPVPLIIPCHRVVRSDGQIGAYSLGGPANKWRLLELEGTDPARLEHLAAEGVRIQANKLTGIYCNPTCHAIRRSNPANVEDFRSVRDAAEGGYRPCRLCKPG